MIADSLQAGALLEYICQHPAEDDARLVYADALEERGEDERAELIRVQCELARDFDRYEFAPRSLPLRQRERELLTPVRMAEWFPIVGPFSVQTTWRRGFPAEVTLTASAFAGGPCGRCGGTGDENSMPGHDRLECRVCRGTGKTPGHAAALLRLAPVEKVTLSDKRPAQGVWPSESWYWEEGDAAFWFLPRDLFDLLTGHRRESQRTDQRPSRQRHYDTGADAHDAFAAAALTFARRAAWPCSACGGSGCPNCKGSGHTVIA